jgi:hypothetical protein
MMAGETNEPILVSFADIPFQQIAVNSEKGIIYGLDQMGRIWYCYHRLSVPVEWSPMPSPRVDF